MAAYCRCGLNPSGVLNVELETGWEEGMIRVKLTRGVYKAQQIR